MKKILSVFLCLCLLFSVIPAADAYAVGQPYHADLSQLIKNEERCAYVQMMLDYHMRNNTMVQMALREGLSALFFFEGCSDNMDHPDLSDLSYYRVSAVCVAVRLNGLGKPYIAYFNDECSTLPDRPLDYGTWQFEDVGEVGPATILDGTYEIYSVKHGGNYEALHMRTDYSDKKLDAVYMTPEGFVRKRATEINIHTRTGNHILKNQMWSAGCVLVSGGDWDRFEELMESTYYAVYDDFDIDRAVGCVTIDRQNIRESMYALYENEDAVDMLLAQSRRDQPERYLQKCADWQRYESPVELCVRGKTQLRNLPCSNPTDARSLEAGEVTRGETLNATAIVKNSENRLWYEIEMDGERCYLYSGYAEEATWRNWITRFFAKLF